MTQFQTLSKRPNFLGCLFKIIKTNNITSLNFFFFKDINSSFYIKSSIMYSILFFAYSFLYIYYYIICWSFYILSPHLDKSILQSTLIHFFNLIFYYFDNFFGYSIFYSTFSYYFLSLLEFYSYFFSNIYFFYSYFIYSVFYSFFSSFICCIFG